MLASSQTMEGQGAGASAAAGHEYPPGGAEPAVEMGGGDAGAKRRERVARPLGQGSVAHTWDVHVHLPAGAVPKDGPSAGVTLITALVSLFTGRTVRADTAMTGEVTLRGLVLPVGGIREKLLAAHRAGMKQVLIPHRNLADVERDLPDDVRQSMAIHGCHTAAEVLARAFPGVEGWPTPRM